MTYSNCVVRSSWVYFRMKIETSCSLLTLYSSNAIHLTRYVSAESPDFQFSCNYLGLDPKSPRAFPEASWNYLPHQITGIAFMMSRESTILAGGILGDDPGLGKTTSMAGLIWQDYLRESSKPSRTSYHPNLILGPAPVVQTWWNELTGRFPNKFNIKVFWGAARDFRGDMRKAHISMSDTFQEWFNLIDTSTPDTLRIIILSTYDTWSSRTLQINRIAQAGRWLQDAPPEISEAEKYEYIQAYSNQEGSTADALVNKWKLELGWKLPAFHLTDDFETPDNMYGRLILDEGHAIKDRTTLRSISVQKTQRQSLWVVTATVIMNSPVDLIGSMILFWNKDWMIRLIETRSITTTTAERLYRDKYQDVRKLSFAKIQSMLAPRYNRAGTPESELGWYRLGLHLINPEVMLLLVEENTMSTQAARYVIGLILTIFSIKRTKETVMELPDGQEIKVGGDIPPMTVNTVELGFNLDEEEKHDPMYEWFMRNRGAGESQGPSAGETHAHVNASMHRKLHILAFDPFLSDIEHAVDTSYEGPIRDIFKSSIDNGATQFLGLRHRTISMPPYESRSSLIKALCAESPKLRYLVSEVIRLSQSRQRCLIFTGFPIIATKILITLVNLGIAVGSISAEDSTEARNSVADT